MKNLKREKPFELNTPKTGDFGGGTQDAEYYNKKGEKVPYNQTKWAKLAKKKGGKI